METTQLTTQFLIKGLALIQASNYNAAIDTFDKALDQASDRTLLVQELSRLRDIARQYAEQIPTNLIDLNTRVIENKEKGIVALGAGEYEQARLYFELVLKDFPNDSETQHLLTQIERISRATIDVPHPNSMPLSPYHRRMQMIGIGVVVMLLVAGGVVGIWTIFSSSSKPSPAQTVDPSQTSSGLPPTQSILNPASQPNQAAVMTITASVEMVPTFTFLLSSTQPLSTTSSLIPTLVPTQLPQMATIAEEGVNIRTGPGTNYSLIPKNGSLHRGKQVELVSTAEGEGCVSDIRHPWVKIRLSDMTEGWICSLFIQKK